MDHNAIKGIIFDYGGTLDTHGTHWVHVLRQGWQAAHMDVPEDVFRQAYVHGERALAMPGAVATCDDFHALLIRKSIAALRSIDNPEQYSDRPENFDIHKVAAVIAAGCDAVAAEHAAASARVLGRLQQRYDLCLVSNFCGNLATVLEAYGLRQYFPHIIESAMVGVRKPDPRIFSIGVTALGLEPDQVLVVGDSIDKDIVPASSIGCHTAWLRGKGWRDTPAAGHHAQYTIDSLEALADALA